jgi:ferredoxin
MENLEAPDTDELERLDVLDGRTEKSRLACQSKVRGPVTVRVVNHD